MCGGYLPAVEFEILWEKCANDLVGIQRNRQRIHSCSVNCRNGLLNSEWIRAFIVWWQWSAGMDLLCWTATFDFSQEEEERRRRVPRIVFQVASIVAVLLACFKEFRSNSKLNCSEIVMGNITIEENATKHLEVSCANWFRVFVVASVYYVVNN